MTTTATDLLDVIDAVLHTAPVDDDFPDVLSRADMEVDRQRLGPHPEVVRLYNEWRALLPSPKWRDKAEELAAAIQLARYGAWWVDCYTSGHVVDDEFPFQSYGPHSLTEALAVVGRVLRNRESGVVRATVTAQTRGVSPHPDR